MSTFSDGDRVRVVGAHQLEKLPAALKGPSDG